jgi:hypothetical protein
MDPAISKILFLHVPSRHPTTYPEVELSPLVQAAALMGIGLLYRGSCHRRATCLVEGHTQWTRSVQRLLDVYRS